jgi:hypothetical protein
LSLENVCIKVDVENAESDFFAGATDALDRINYLIMEVLGPAHAAGFIQQVMRTPFHAYYINDYTLEFSSDGSFEYCPPEYNWLFCREDPASLAKLLADSGLKVVANRRTASPALRA